MLQCGRTTIVLLFPIGLYYGVFVFGCVCGVCSWCVLPQAMVKSAPKAKKPKALADEGLSNQQKEKLKEHIQAMEEFKKKAIDARGQVDALSAYLPVYVDAGLDMLKAACEELHNTTANVKLLSFYI